MRSPIGTLAADYPGFPSLTTNYKLKNDFFLSGNIAFALISFLEFKQTYNSIVLATFSVITIVMQLFLAIGLRRGYSIDLFSGLVFAHYFWLLSEKYSYFIDVKLLRIPLSRRKLGFVQACENC